jgi:hypothetical protein
MGGHWRAEVSDIGAELVRVRDAFSKPTLRLLDRKGAPLALSVFRTSFTRDQRVIPADRLHQQVDNYLDELRFGGEPVPDGPGREDGTEHYSLTSHALEALDLIQSLARDRSLISESRIHTILDVVRRVATDANPDRQSRLDRLDAQIAELKAERDRIAAGGEIAPASDDQMLDGYTNLLSLIGQLPSDFKRVEEAVTGMHRQIISDFRSEDRPIAEVIDQYLAKSDSLMSLTAEGRAFEGAFTLLRDEPLLADLRRDLGIILTHPFAEALTAGEQREFRRTVNIIRDGIRDVLVQRRRLSATLRDHIVDYDMVRDHELDATLRQVNQQLEVWMRTAGPRATIGVELVPSKIDVQHLRERFWDPAGAAPPPPLEDVSDTAPPPPGLDAIRHQGGPALAALHEQLVAAVVAGDSSVGTVAALFGALPDSLRRPAELIGLIHLVLGSRTSEASDRLADDEVLVATAGREEQVEAIRPDGTRRVFAIPVLSLRPDDAADFAEGAAL